MQRYFTYNKGSASIAVSVYFDEFGDYVVPSGENLHVLGDSVLEMTEEEIAKAKPIEGFEEVDYDTYVKINNANPLLPFISAIEPQKIKTSEKQKQNNDQGNNK